jgi:hypothetical protein
MVFERFLGIPPLEQFPGIHPEEERTPGLTLRLATMVFERFLGIHPLERSLGVHPEEERTAGLTLRLFTAVLEQLSGSHPVILSRECQDGLPRRRLPRRAWLLAMTSDGKLSRVVKHPLSPHIPIDEHNTEKQFKHHYTIKVKHPGRMTNAGFNPELQSCTPADV